MRIRKTSIILLAVLLVFTALTQAMASDWTDFGGDENRRHLAADPLSPPVAPKWAAQLGRSVSQPLVVGDRIYVLAGGSLWCLDANAPPGLNVTLDDINNGTEAARQLVVWQVSGINEGNVSRSDPVYRDGVIYLGTGGGRVAAVDAATGAVLGLTERLGPDGVEVVSAPLIFDNGEVVVGTSTGYVWIIRGLTEGAPEGNSLYLGGRVTCSSVKVPVRDGQAFVVADDGGPGRVKAFYVGDGVRNDFDPVWASWISSGPVPASFAVDQDGVTFYFSNKYGKLFKGNLLAGSAEANAVHYSSTASFVNNSPGVGNSFVYFTFRKLVSTGRLVALDKTSWDIVWEQDLPSWGNTSPLVWQACAAVLAGDTGGHLSAFNSANGGEPYPFAPNPDDPQGPLQPVLNLSDNPYQDPDWWRKTSGLGTELTLASGSTGQGLLLFGVNQSSGIYDGWLFCYSTGRFKNLKVATPDPDNPSSALSGFEGGYIQPGDKVTVNVRVKYEYQSETQQLPEPVDTPVGWKFSSDPTDWRLKDGLLHLEPGGEAGVELTDIEVPDGAVSILVCVNPYRNQPQGETTYADNTVEIPLPVARPNLKITSLDFSPTKPAGNATVSLSVTVANDSSFGYGRDIVTDISWYVDGVLKGTRTNVTVPAKGSVVVDGFSFQGTQDRHSVKFFVNPAGSRPANEKIYPADNIITRDIYFSSDLDLYVESCSGGVFGTNRDVSLSAVVGSSAESVKDASTKVEFWTGESKIGEQAVTLAPGQKKTVSVNWHTPSTPFRGTLKVYINRAMTPAEKTYANNISICGVDVRADLTGISCLGEWVHPTEPYCVDGSCDSWSCNCDEYGCDCCCSCTTTVHDESLSLEVQNLNPTTVKAGQGFSFTVRTNYTCSDCSRDTACGGDCSAGENKTCPRDPYGGAVRVVAFFPEGFVGTDLEGVMVGPINGYVGIEMEPQKTIGSHQNTWVLPRVVLRPTDIAGGDRGDDITYVSDSYILNPGEHEGGRKHYTPFWAKDGPYTFVVAAWGGSRGYNLVNCVQGVVTISGSPYDDFVTRRVDPHNPFPAGVGWNWKGKVDSVFTPDVLEFWDTWGASADAYDCWWSFVAE